MWWLPVAALAGVALKKAYDSFSGSPDPIDPPSPEPKIKNPQDHRAAIHEAGHAICAWHNPFVREITAIRIDNQGMGGGSVHYTTAPLEFPSQMWWQIVVGLGGIAAELEEFDGFRSGPATPDIKGVVMLATKLTSLGAPNPPWSNPHSLPSKYFDVSKTLRSVSSQDKSAAVMNLALVKARLLYAEDKRRMDIIRLLAKHNGHLDHSHVRQIFGSRYLFF